MFVGVLRLSLHLPEPGSLKSKRHLVRSAIDRVKSRFNVSIAEVAENDLWQRSVLGVTAVGNEHAFVNETLDKVADFVASMHGGQLQVLDRAIAIDTFPDGMGDDGLGRSLAEAEQDRSDERGRRGASELSRTEHREGEDDDHGDA
ncbi:MAG TPA: DUF503 domain-containing protein [Anaeromyxobacteraceae bacterium]|nr:DUF503 domain-containing protein [Anaeromyxobacteraceae bacterium]